MATFSAYPALQVRAPDITGAIQRGREDVQTNWLRQTKIQSGIAEQGRLNQLRAIMPGVGAEAGLGEKAQQALGLDPALLGKFMEMSKDKRAQIKQTIERVANLLAPFADPGVAPIQKAQMWPKMLQRAQAMGLPLDEVPQQFDPQWVMMEMAEAGQHKDMLDRADTMSPEAEAQKIRIAKASRVGEGGVTPAQQANNAEIDAARLALNRMNLDRAEILRRTQKSTNTGRENPDYDPSLERLVRTATQRKVGNDPKFNLYHRRYLGPAPEFSESAGPKALPPGVSAEQPGVLDRLGEFFSGGDDTATAPRRGRRRGRGRIRGRGGSTKKPIQQMSKAEIANLLDERGEDLTEDERKSIQARLDALGL